MTIGIGAILLVVLWLGIESYCGGWWNFVDTLSYWLHRYSVNGRAMQDKRTAFVGERWMREIEKT